MDYSTVEDEGLPNDRGRTITRRWNRDNRRRTVDTYLNGRKYFENTEYVINETMDEPIRTDIEVEFDEWDDMNNSSKEKENYGNSFDNIDVKMVASSKMSDEELENDDIETYYCNFYTDYIKSLQLWYAEKPRKWETARHKFRKIKSESTYRRTLSEWSFILIAKELRVKMETNKLSMTYVVGDESEMSLRKTNTKKHSFSEKDAHEMTRCDTIFQEIFHESSYEPKTSTFNDDDDSMNSTNIMSKELELSGSVDLDLTNNTNSTVDEFPTEILNRNKNSSRIDRESLISLKQKTNDIDAVFEANMTLVTGDYSSHDETSLTNKSIDYTHTQPKKKKYMENENITLKNPIHKKEMISRRLSSSYSDEYKSFDETISTTIYNSQKNFNKNSVIEELQIPEISHIEKSMKNHTICEQTLNLSSFSVEK
ncbi:hypothetical protein SNEBB_009515, partial [Seison nebaliae]